MKSFKKKEKTIVWSGRIRETLYSVAFNLCKNMGLSKSDFLELAIVEMLSKTSQDLIFNGVDFKDYLEVIKLEKLRNIEGKKKQEVISRHLFIERVNYDVSKYIFYKKNKKEVLEMLEQHRKIAIHYKSKKPLEEIDKIIDKIKNKDYLQFQNEIRLDVSKQLKSKYRLEQIKTQKNDKRKKKI